MFQERSVANSHATIAVRDTGGGGVPVLMIHGNSSSGEAFRNQLNGDIGAHHRLIAPDLPGHGNSSDAIDPERSYNIPGYADMLIELLRQLGIDRAIVFGWSLGGHIGIDMIPRFSGMIGLMITGTPPVSPDQIALGFRPSPQIGLAGKEVFSEMDVDTYGRATCGEPFEPFLRAATARTDGRARRIAVQRFASGVDADQARIVAAARLPIAVVNGSDEPFVNTDFVAKASYGNLWEGRCHQIEHSGHAPFWDRPAAFDLIFERFLTDMSSSLSRG